MVVAVNREPVTETDEIGKFPFLHHPTSHLRVNPFDGSVFRFDIVDEQPGFRQFLTDQEALYFLARELPVETRQVLDTFVGHLEYVGPLILAVEDPSQEYDRIHYLLNLFRGLPKAELLRQSFLGRDDIAGMVSDSRSLMNNHLNNPEVSQINFLKLWFKKAFLLPGLENQHCASSYWHLRYQQALEVLSIKQMLASLCAYLETTSRNPLPPDEVQMLKLQHTADHLLGPENILLSPRLHPSRLMRAVIGGPKKSESKFWDKAEPYLPPELRLPNQTRKKLAADQFWIASKKFDPHHPNHQGLVLALENRLRNLI